MTKRQCDREQRVFDLTVSEPAATRVRAALREAGIAITRQWVGHEGEHHFVVYGPTAAIAIELADEIETEVEGEIEEFLNDARSSDREVFLCILATENPLDFWRGGKLVFYNDHHFACPEDSCHYCRSPGMECFRHRVTFEVETEISLDDPDIKENVRALIAKVGLN